MVWQRRFFYGRGTQYNEFTAEQLAVMLTSLTSAAETELLKDKNIWVVETCSIGVPDQYIMGRRTEIPPKELVSFFFFYADKCLTPTQHGAYTAKLTEDVTLYGGWSSRASAFNSTGIHDVHVTEVTLVQGGPQGVGFAVCAPVTWVRRIVEVTSNGFYSLFKGFEDRGAGFQSYWIVRDLERLQQDWIDRRIEPNKA
jgi:hypothetical protein